jgi:transcriptional regulator with GAF, ATPase, and Fis domain
LTRITLHATEREAIVQALRATHGKIAGTGGAAEQLGLKRTTLQGKMRRLEILKTEYSS